MINFFMSNILILHGFLGNFNEGLLKFLYENLSSDNNLVTPNLLTTQNRLMTISEQISVISQNINLSKSLKNGSGFDLIIGYSLGGYACWQTILQNFIQDNTQNNNFSLTCPILLIAPLVKPTNFIKTRFTIQELKNILSLNIEETITKDFGRDRIYKINRKYIQDFLLAPEIDFLEIPEKIRSQINTVSFTNDATIANYDHLSFNPLLRLLDNHGCEEAKNRDIILNFIKTLI